MRAMRAVVVVCAVVSFLSGACSPSSGREEARRAQTDAAATAAAVRIYDDALASGWADWSWGSRRNFAATSPVASGKRSLAVTFQAWGGIYFRHTAGPVSGMAALELSINGGRAAGSWLELWAVQGSTELTRVFLPSYCTGGTIPANAWTRCKVPLSALAPAGSSIDGLILQETDGTARPTMYFDDVALTGGGSAPPPPAITVAISPASATVDACTGAQFSASVTGAADGSVAWSIQEGAAGGKVDAAGKYTAPSSAGTYHVVATSKASSSASAAVPVVVRDRIVSLALNPSSAPLAAGARQQFAATVTTSCGTFTAAGAQ
jgi:chitinase